jgi:hypothetical protein
MLETNSEREIVFLSPGDLEKRENKKESKIKIKITDRKFLNSSFIFLKKELLYFLRLK